MEPVLDDPPEFTDEELKRVLKEVGEDARREAFAVGRPVMILRDSKLILLHGDGSEEVVAPVQDANGWSPVT